MSLNTAVLAKLSTEALIKVRDEVNKALADRLDTRPAPGRMGEFVAKSGEVVRVIVERVNQKTVSCRCLKTGTGWRVGRNLLKIDPVERKAPVDATARKAAIQATAARLAQDAW